MTHLLPPHPDLNLAHSSLQTALQIDPNQQPPPTPQGQQQQQPPPPVPQSASRKRRKVDQNGDEPPQPAEPRRLRRSHEACARCRSKKIKASPVGRHRRQTPVSPPDSANIRAPSSSLPYSPPSATPSIPAAPPAQPPAPLVTRRIVTARPSHPVAIPNASSASSSSARRSSNGTTPPSTSMTSTTSSPVRASSLIPATTPSQLRSSLPPTPPSLPAVASLFVQKSLPWEVLPRGATLILCHHPLGNP